MSKSKTELDFNKVSLLDPVTALQDSIDGLSLSLFEALRKLRDTVTPSQPSVKTDSQLSLFADSNQELPDYEEFLIAVAKDDPHALNLIQTIAGGHPPKSRDEYVKFAAKVQMDRDMVLVSTLSKEVFAKSDAVESWLAKIPGMERDREAQMERIQQLIQLNKDQEEEWRRVFEEAKELQRRLRNQLQRHAMNLFTSE